ncbi:hypothetical protein, partial, partial [Parasitella parasitica]
LIDEEEDLGKRYERELIELYVYWRDPLHHQDCDLKTKRKALRYRVLENHLYRRAGQRWLKVPFLDERKQVLIELHDGHGHFGQQATWARVYKDYWWPGVYEQVREFVKTCQPCQLFGDKYNTNPPRRNVVQGLKLFEQFSIDFVGPFPESKAGNRYLLVASEGFTRWPVAVPSKAADADTVAAFLYKHVFTVFGPPTHLLSDNGSHFDNEVIDRFLAIVKTHHQFAAPYRPQTNGRVEKLNGTLGKAIKKLALENPLEWDNHVDAVLYAYRTKAHAVVNVSPFELLYGQQPRAISQDILQDLGRSLGFERLVKLEHRNFEQEDKEYEEVRVLEDNMFEPGTRVVRVRNKKRGKLDSNYDPEVFTVIAGFGDGSYQLMDNQGRVLKRRLNRSNLKRFHQRI